MSLKIGVSGVRGIVGDSLTREVVSDFAKAFGTFVKTEFRFRKTLNILIGRDTRSSGEFVKKTVIDGLLATGCTVTDIDLCPTPGMLFLTRYLKADGAIIITASHNPAQYNGLKFVWRDGTFLTKQGMDKLVLLYKGKNFTLPPNKRDSGIVLKKDALKLYLDKVIESVDVKAIKKARFKVAVDYCNGTGAVTTPYLLKRLGCEILAINIEPNGKFAHNPEPVAENLGQLCEFVKKTKADVGFAQDPDADRLAIVSEKGVAIGEENTLALAVKHVLAKRQKFQHKKGSGPFLKVVVNLSTSRMIDDIAKEFGAGLYRSAVGETNVVDKMRQVKAIIGGEGNGGVIYPSVNFGRDSFIAMALILEYMAGNGKTISQLVGSIRQYYIEKINKEYPQEKIPSILEAIKERFKKEKINTLDGVKIDWPDGWVHVRGSNTEPVIRITAEAPTKKMAMEYIEKIRSQI